MKTVQTPPRRRRKEARPQEILEAALQLFVKKGYSATKVEDIARAAGVTCGTPYRYFANKEEIFKALIREYLLPKLELGESLLTQHEGSARELLVKVLMTWWEVMGMTSLSALPKLMMAEACNFPDVTRLYFEAFSKPAHQILEEVLKRGMASGEFRQVDIQTACDVLTAPMMMAMIRQHSAMGQVVTHPGITDMSAVIHLMLEGLVNHQGKNNG